MLAFIPATRTCPVRVMLLELPELFDIIVIILLFSQWIWSLQCDNTSCLVEWRHLVQLLSRPKAIVVQINPLNTKRRLLYIRPSSYRAVNTFHLGYKNQSVHAVSGPSRCLFSDKYKTHKYSVSRTYSCWMSNCWCITWPVGFRRLIIKQANRLYMLQ